MRFHTDGFYNKNEIAFNQNYQLAILRNSTEKTFALFHNSVTTDSLITKVKVNGFKNYGIWSLGYVGDTSELTTVLSKHGNIITRSSLGRKVLAYLGSFILFGFLFSIFRYWQVRNILAKYKKYLWIVGGGFLVLLIANIFLSGALSFLV